MDTGDATAGAAFQQSAGATISSSYALTANGTASVTDLITGITSLYPWGAVGPVSVGSGGKRFTDRNVLTNAQVAGTQTANVALTGSSSGSSGILSGTIFAWGTLRQSIITLTMRSTTTECLRSRPMLINLAKGLRRRRRSSALVTGLSSLGLDSVCSPSRAANRVSVLDSRVTFGPTLSMILRRRLSFALFRA